MECDSCFKKEVLSLKSYTLLLLVEIQDQFSKCILGFNLKFKNTFVIQRPTYYHKI